MPRLVLISLLLSLTVGSAFAQSKKIDSLRAVLAKHPQADTFRVNRLTDLAKALQFPEKGYNPLHMHQSDSVFNLALELAKRLKYTYGQALTLYNAAQASHLLDC